MQNLRNLHRKVTDYYASLINKLDTEANTRIKEYISKAHTINHRNKQFINKIIEIEIKNLTNLEKLDNFTDTIDEELLNEMVYANEFCFLVERKQTGSIGYFLFVSPVYVNEYKRNIIQLGFNSTNLEKTDEILNLTSLQDLDLSNKLLASIDRDSFHGLPSLQAINLSDNQLTSINQDTFRGLNGLQTINLSYSQLTSIEQYAFSGLASLLDLNLSYNQLASIDRKAFSDSTNLLELNLSHNKLAIIDQDTFGGLKSLQVLNLSHNKIS